MGVAKVYLYFYGNLIRQTTNTLGCFMIQLLLAHTTDIKYRLQNQKQIFDRTGRNVFSRYGARIKHFLDDSAQLMHYGHILT